jgi:hypothetical protein
LAGEQLREAEIGNRELARRAISSALANNSVPEINKLAALALARAGDSAHAERMAEELSKNDPTNTPFNFYWLDTIRAAW